MKIITFFFIAFFLSAPLQGYGIFQGKKVYEHQQEEWNFVKTLYQVKDPWYSGPLLAPSANTLPPGLVNVQPYLFWTKNFGSFNSHWHASRVSSMILLNPQVIVQVGLNNFASFVCTSQAFYKRFGNQSSFNYGDTPLSLNIQLLKSILNSPVPSCKFSIGETFPSGRYQHLNPNKLGTDASGGGSYITTFQLAFQKTIYSFKKDLNPRHFHPMTLRLGTGYALAAKTRIEGCNAYGGSPTTRGTVNPPNTFNVVFAWEYSLTQSWVFATDWQYTVSSRTSFVGRTGGIPIDAPGSQNISVAPALEYNLTDNFGALIGVWFSFAGKNSTDFVSGVATFTWTF